ncbi:MAG: malonyl-ACP O-methyltransferase BioC [Candidatus Berkiella sp.]
MQNSKKEVIASFNKAAFHYEAHAFVQNVIGARLLERLSFITSSFTDILDAGCGTGHFLQQLRKLYPKSNITGVDIAQEMLAQAQNKKSAWLQKKPTYVHADIETLPFEDNQFDLIFCNLVLHWSDLERALESFKRVLKPGGMLLFTIPGPDTLFELFKAFEKIDNFSHVNSFLDMHDYGDHLQKLQFQNVVMDMEKIVFEYDSVWQLLKDLKYTGVRNIHQNRRQQITPRSHLDKLAETYRRQDNKYPVTFEVVFGHAICPVKKEQRIKNCIPLTVVPA